MATELITSSEDGVVCIWSRGKGPADYWLVQTLRDMHHSVVSLHAIAATNGSLLCACDSKGNIHVWYKPFEDMEKRDYGYRSVHVASSPPSQMPNCVCAFAIPLGDDAADGTAETIMIALGGVDCRIVVTLISAADVHRAYMALGSGECAYVGQRVVGVLSGHEDWITSLSCAEVAGQLMLASGSQDSKIRLWRFARCSAPSAKSMIIGVSGVTAVDMQESDSEDDDIVEEGAEQVLQTEEDFDDEARFSFSVADGKYWFSAFLEALLVGHEDWVTSVQWVKETNGGCQLFSTSMDRNMLLWEAEAGGIWIPTVRIGDIGGNLGGSVGANLLGFVNGVITESGR